MKTIIIKISALLSIIALVCCGLYCTLPVYQPYPKPTGSYGVGTITTTLVDPHKPEIKLTWFYPTSTAKSNTQHSTQPLAGQEYVQEKLRHSWVPMFVWTHLLGTINSYAAPGVPAAPNQRYPIIIFAPNDNPYITYVTYLEELASHGYIIVATTHTADDLTRVIDALSIYDTDQTFILHNKLHLEHIGTLGHGVGAKKTTNICSTDHRCIASISMDWFSPTMTHSTKPLMAFLGKEWTKREDVPHRQLQELDDPFLSFVTNDFSTNAFSDHVLLRWPWSTLYGIGPHWARTAIADCIRIFFDWYLKNDLKIKQPSQQPGAIVVLNGTSSAGKSALANELNLLYGDTCRVIKIDDFEEFYVIKNPLIAFSGPKEYFTPERLEKRWRDFYTYAKRLAVSGFHVIVDTILFDEKYTNILGDDQVHMVLVYCPLETIIERVEQRSKNELERRTVAQAVGQFSEIYKIQESVTEPVVDHVLTSHMQTALDIAIKELGATEKVPREFIIKFKQDFTEQFKLKTLNRIILTIKKPWDLIVNSGSHSPRDLALIISDYLKIKGLRN